MAKYSFRKYQLLQILLTIPGLFAVLAIVYIVAVLAKTLTYILFSVLLGLLMGISPMAIIKTFSISQIVSGQGGDLLSWVGAFLLFVILLPYLDRYYHWVGRVLREKD